MALKQRHVSYSVTAHSSDCQEPDQLLLALDGMSRIRRAVLHGKGSKHLDHDCSPQLPGSDSTLVPRYVLWLPLESAKPVPC
jgi:hypothetical protein